MKEPVNFEARLIGGLGALATGVGPRGNSKDLDVAFVEAAEEDGIFRNVDEISGRVDEVCYRIDDDACPEADRDHNLSFKTYSEMGNPKRISVERNFSYSPLLD